jgi:hypothetical protein
MVLFFDIQPPVKFAIASVTILFFTNEKIFHLDKFFILLLPMFYGMFYGIYNNTSYNIAKDVFYLISPIVYIIMGTVLYKKIKLRYILKLIVVFGVLITLKKMFLNYSAGGFSGLINPFSVRYESGFRGDVTPTLALSILFFSNLFDIKIYRKKVLLSLLAINFLGFYLMASRVYMIVFLCFCIAYLIFRYRHKLTLISISTLLLLFIMYVFISDIKFGTYSSDSFFGKIANSVNEINATNYRTDEEINTKYRGFESFMAWKGYIKGSIGTILFGEMGKLIDLEVYVVSLSDKPMRMIPILHNGYLYLLIKTGIVGVLMYAIFFFRLISFGVKMYFKTKNTQVNFIVNLYLGSIFAILITNYVITAFYSGEMLLLQLLIGFGITSLNDFNQKSQTNSYE